MDANLKKSCTWKSSDKNYASTFVMNKDKIACTVDFSNVTVKDSAVINVTGFDIGGGKHVSTQSRLLVGSKRSCCSVWPFHHLISTLFSTENVLNQILQRADIFLSS